MNRFAGSRLSPTLHPRSGDLGHPRDHERIAQSLWLLTALTALLLVNVLVLWVVVTS